MEMSPNKAIEVGVEACKRRCEVHMYGVPSGSAAHEAYTKAAATLAKLAQDLERVRERLAGIAEKGYATDDMLFDLRAFVGAPAQEGK